jgi:hypothetical protein
VEENINNVQIKINKYPQYKSYDTK